MWFNIRFNIQFNIGFNIRFNIALRIPLLDVLNVNKTALIKVSKPCNKHTNKEDFNIMTTSAEPAAAMKTLKIFLKHF